MISIAITIDSNQFRWVVLLGKIEHNFNSAMVVKCQVEINLHRIKIIP